MQSSVVLTLAWRNLWRNYRRTIIMLLAIMVGVWAMIFMTAMMRGMVDDMIRSGIRHLPGHVQIHHPSFRDDPNIVNSIPQMGTEAQEFFRTAGVELWLERLTVPAVISSERDVRGITLLGVQPTNEAQMAFNVEQITQGRWLKSSHDNGIVIGEKLAERLETDLGKRVVIMSQDINNVIAERGVRIVGIYRSENVALEESVNVYMGLTTAQVLLHAHNMVSLVAFNGEDYRKTQPLLRVVQQSSYVKQHNVEVLPWHNIDTYLGSMLPVMDGFVLIWVLVVFLALSFGLVNTLVMAVFERIREIGLMQALGMKPTSILLQVLCEALMLLVLGLLGGNILAILTILPFASGIDVSVVAKGMEMMGANAVLYPELKLNDVILANVVVIVLGIIASILPAWRASQYDPIVALNKL